MLCTMPTMTRGRTGLGARHSALFSSDPFGRFPKEGGGGGKSDDDEIDLGSDDGGKGGDEDEPEDEDEPDEDESEDEDEESEDEDELGDKGKRAIQKEREKNKALRRELRELRKKGEGEPDKAAAEAEAKWKPVFVKREAAHALREAGLIGKPDRLLKLLDIDTLDVDIDDETGEVEIDGLDDAVADIRKEYPSLFRKRGSSAIDAADNSTDQLRSRREKRSATERQADFLLGRG